jgi:uncharacterized protein YegP (UPF0339 family)
MAGESDTFELYQDKRGAWRWRRKAANGKIVGAACEGYADRSGAEANMTRGAVAADLWDFYQDKRGEWRWRRKAANGKIVGASCEGYRARADAEANAMRQGWAA